MYSGDTPAFASAMSESTLIPTWPSFARSMRYADGTPAFCSLTIDGALSFA